ncbi:hypothetical protein [Candidatus Spongiisocius sp.]|uniref:hypothetical protein n=1 Tax=Candidatus Spongiisocius sp. TaxID=3101273 RepID=UPI003B5C5D2F
MERPDAGTAALTPEEGWNTIHQTLDRTRNSMYLAGTATILLLWGAIVAMGFASQYAVHTLASDFAADRPWYPGPLWGVLVVAGMTGSAIIGNRASRKIAVGTVMRSAGIRVFLFWLAIVVATLLIPAAAGLWTGGEDATRIPYVAIGIVTLGFVLFGIMVRPVLAVVGLGLAMAFYIPAYLVEYPASAAVSAAAILVVVGVCWAWIRRSGVL